MDITEKLLTTIQENSSLGPHLGPWRLVHRQEGYDGYMTYMLYHKSDGSVRGVKMNYNPNELSQHPPSKYVNLPQKFSKALALAYYPYID